MDYGDSRWYYDLSKHPYGPYLVEQLDTTYNELERLYKKLEKEVDHSAGLRINGALSIAQTDARWQELQRQATTAQLYLSLIHISEPTRPY